jgi:hypothetical protein
MLKFPDLMVTDYTILSSDPHPFLFISAGLILQDEILFPKTNWYYGIFIDKEIILPFYDGIKTSPCDCEEIRQVMSVISLDSYLWHFWMKIYYILNFLLVFFQLIFFIY